MCLDKFEILICVKNQKENYRIKAENGVKKETRRLSSKKGSVKSIKTEHKSLKKTTKIKEEENKKPSMRIKRES